MFLGTQSDSLPVFTICKGDSEEEEDVADVANVELNISYDAVLVVSIAGPGIGKEEMRKAIGRKFPTFHTVNISRLLRDSTQNQINKGVEEWTDAALLINNGDLVADGLVLEALVKELNEHVNVDGYVIEGYPRNRRQLAQFKKYIGLERLHFVVLVDCEEGTCLKVLLRRSSVPGWSDNLITAICQRIANYKAHTLGVLKYFDDHHKLRLVNGDRKKEEVVKDIVTIFRTELPEFEMSKVPTEVVKEKVCRTHAPDVVKVEDIPELFNIVDEISRPKEFPQCPIILLLGGPGSGKTEVAQELCARFQDWVHMDINSAISSRIFDNGIQSQNWDFLATLSNKNAAALQQDQLVMEHWNINVEFIKDEMKKLQPNTQGIVMEGFPKDGEQLNEYNSKIGRADLVILLDCDEFNMSSRLSERSDRLHRPDDEVFNAKRRITFFREIGLAIPRYYDERHRLNIVSADRKAQEVAADVVSLVEAAIMTTVCSGMKSLGP